MNATTWIKENNAVIGFYLLGSWLMASDKPIVVPYDKLQDIVEAHNGLSIVYGEDISVGILTTALNDMGITTGYMYTADYGLALVGSTGLLRRLRGTHGIDQVLRGG
jgi:hypothetical protein